MLGEEHPDTLTSMNNLASTLRAQGDYAGARRLQERVLEVRTRVLGEEHPDTLTSMHNLALTLSAQSDHSGARQLQDRVLEVMRSVHGEEHPDTLTAMNNLAATLWAEGDLKVPFDSFANVSPADARSSATITPTRLPLPRP